MIMWENDNDNDDIIYWGLRWGWKEIGAGRKIKAEKYYILKYLDMNNLIIVLYFHILKFVDNFYYFSNLIDKIKI